MFTCEFVRHRTIARHLSRFEPLAHRIVVDLDDHALGQQIFTQQVRQRVPAREGGEGALADVVGVHRKDIDRYVRPMDSSSHFWERLVDGYSLKHRKEVPDGRNK